MAQRTIVLGSRGSRLALIQATMVMEKLQQYDANCDFRIDIIHTSGDDGQVEVVGAFTGEVEQALYRGDIDIAVHSMKDMPTLLPDGLTIGAVPPRADHRDAFLSRSYPSWRVLPQGATVGTSSRRRAALLRFLRPDIVVTPLRGNVDTRLRKLDEGQYDAIILAAAGLERSGLLHRVTEYMETDSMLPAVAQGALGVEIRSDDELVVAMMQCLEHADTRVAVEAERAFLRGLGGGCRSPIAAYAHVQDGALHIEGAMAEEGDSVVLYRAAHTGSLDNAIGVGNELARIVLSMAKGEGGHG